MKKNVCVLILRAPGTNCEEETQQAFSLTGNAKTDVVRVSELLAHPFLLKRTHIFVIPGGFSYGDDLGAGKIVANELRLRLWDELVDFYSAGKLILGICNGFQILIKMGLLPNPFMRTHDVTLTFNENQRFECRWIYLRICSGKSIYFKGMEFLTLPIAHGEGRFWVSRPSVYGRLRSQVALEYMISPLLEKEGRGRKRREAGQFIGGKRPQRQDGPEPLSYPYNPNGSYGNVAALTDPTGRVLGMMPHPERFVFAHQHPAWTRRSLQKEPAGLTLFRNATTYVEQCLL